MDATWLQTYREKQDDFCLCKEYKQDCETKAFKRLAARIKEDFPRLPILLLGDSLYAGEPVFDICKKNHWNYIIRYKEGSIMREYEAIPEKEKKGNPDLYDVDKNFF